MKWEKEFKELTGLIKVHTECLRSQEQFNVMVAEKMNELITRIEELEKKNKKDFTIIT